jgi:hypothetical protein
MIALRTVDASFREVKRRYDERHRAMVWSANRDFYKNCAVLKL